MAKKVIIQGEELLHSLNDDWGGINNTDEAIEKYGTTVLPGQEWGMNRGEVERFEKQILQEHETGIEDNANNIETLSGVAIGDVEEGAINPATNKKPIRFYKANDTDHEHPVTIEVLANVGGEEKIPRISVSLNTASTIKKGDTIDFDWVYDFIHRIDGEEQQGGIRPTPQNVTIEVKAGNTLIYSDTVNGGVVEHQPYNVRFANPNVTGMVTITVMATVVIDGEVAEARGGEVVNIVEMRLSTDFSPASQLAISNGITDGQTISIPYSYTVPNGTTLRVFIDGSEPITSSISGTGRNFVTLQSSELVAGRHNVQMIAENNGLLSDAVIVDFLKAGGSDDYLGLRLAVAVADIEEIEDMAQNYGSYALPLTVEQFGSVTINFAAWQSATLMSEVRVYVDGAETPTQVLSVDRSLQSLSQRFDTSGSHTMSIAVGNAVMGFSVSVQEVSGIPNQDVPGYLLKLSANGRSNNEAHPDDWGGITTFEGVNWNTNGWNTDSEGVTSLLLTNGATAKFDIKPFVIDGDYSIQLAGFAVGMKVKVSQVMERGATVVRCLYDNEGEGYPMGIQVTTEKAALLFGGTERITTAEDLKDEEGNYIDYEGNIVDEEHKVPLIITRPFGTEMNIAIDQWMDLFFIAYPSSGGYGLGFLYINGELSRANRYSGALRQIVPQSILVDSDKADVRVRGLYYYRFPLISDEVLLNTIINQHSAAEIKAMYERNAVGDSNNTVDADGNIAISHDTLIAKRKGTLTIIRSGDSGMGLTDLFNCVDKKQNFKADLVKWEPPLDEDGNPIGEGFEARNVRIRIQGTSSVKYPYKNIRIYLTTAQDGTRVLIIGGVDVTDTAKGYALRGPANSIVQAVLCAKTDFVDSSLAGNTGGAHLFDYTMRALGLLTPPQQYQLDHGQNVTVRQSVDGLPCDIFAGTSENGTLTYCGQFVLNNEKSKSGKIFGMEGVAGFSGTEANPYSIALEALDNNSPMTLFHPAGSANSEALDNQLSEMLTDKTSRFGQGFEFNYPEDHFWTQAEATANGGSLISDNAKTDIKRWLGWLYDCMTQTVGVQAGTMTLENPDYGTSSGWPGKSKWVCPKFKNELSQYFDRDHLLTYYLIIDYLAGKDQLTKNIIWRCWNRLIWYSTFYDGDTWEAIRNDAFIVYLYNITRDSYDTERSKYAFEGHSSWLWCLVLANFEEEIRACAANLRNQLTTQAMLDEFVGKMIGNWSERQYNKSGKLKYVDTIDTMNYVYTLTGSRKAHITSFLKDRSRLLDARYAVGQYNGDVITFTVVRNENDTPSSLTLRSGDLYYFGYKLNGLWLQGPTQVNANDTLELIFSQTLATNDPLMLGGASCIKEIDFTNMGSQLNGTVNLSLCTMLTKLVMPATNGAANAPLLLGDISKLQYIDITGQTSIHTGTAGVFDVSKQSRLGTLLAGDTLLSTINLPEGAPVTVLTLPSTLTLLKLRYLPELAASGLTLQGTANITGFNFAACPHLDWQSLLSSCHNVANVRVEGITGLIDPDWLEDLASMGGYDANGNTIANPALVGSVTLSKVVTDAKLAELRAAFIYLDITECQYSVYEIDDTLNSAACVKNLENNTIAEDAYGRGYVASGHAVKVRDKMKPYFGRLDAETHKWTGFRVSDADYKKDANGNGYSYADSMGEGNDLMMLLPHCWYKGVNDYKNQKKYICWSAHDQRPQSSATRTVSYHLDDAQTESAMRVKTQVGVRLSNINVGTSHIDDEGVLTSILMDASGLAVYRVDVEGMKQVRWPGIKNVNYGVCFTNEEGIIIDKWTLRVDDNDFDFQETYFDYLFIDVPPQSKYFYFTVRIMASTDSRSIVLVTDSDEIEAIEPDWVEHKACMLGVYQAWIDTSGDNIVDYRLRSITGKTCKRGNGTSSTGGWHYDSEGNPIPDPQQPNTPYPTSLNFTMKDFQNISRLRGEGYQLVDYEMSKFVALLFYCLFGTLDSQSYCGNGNSGLTSGYSDGIGNNTSVGSGNTEGNNDFRIGSGNKCLGLESFFGCYLEWMDNCCVNRSSYELFYKGSMTSGGTTENGRWSIYNPDSMDEDGNGNPVKERFNTCPSTANTSSTGGYIKRVRHGRFCDLTPSVLNGDSTTRYCDYYYYTTSGRVFARAYNFGYAYGGVAFAYASDASSNSYTTYGSRLAFRGAIELQEP